MEIQDRGDYRTYSFRHRTRFHPGIILVAIGALFLLNNVHIIYLREWMAYWPVVLIAGGIVKLVDSVYPSGRVAGGILMAAGGILLAQTLGYIDVRARDLWPLILIAVGVMLLFQRTYEWKVRLPNPRVRVGRGFAYDESASTPDRVNIDAIFSGGKRVITSQNFQGGAVTAVFGGIELDLRQAGMVADSAVLEIDAIFGGVEVRIPSTWSADVHGVGIFGGFGDHSSQPYPPAPGYKRLIVKGSAVFGGVDVKN